MRQSGLIAPFLVVIFFFGVLEGSAHDATSEQSILDEPLEGTLRGTPQARKIVHSGTTFSSLPHGLRRSLELTRWVSLGYDFFDSKTNMQIHERTFKNIFFGWCLLYFWAMPHDFVCHTNMQIDKYTNKI
jgi:hypothetical protein